MTKRFLTGAVVVLMGQVVYGADPNGSQLDLKSAAAAAAIPPKNPNPDFSGRGQVFSYQPNWLTSFFYDRQIQNVSNQATPPVDRSLPPGELRTALELEKFRHMECATPLRKLLPSSDKPHSNNSSNPQWDQFKFAILLSLVTTAVFKLLNVGTQVWQDWNMTPEQKQARNNQMLRDYLDGRLDKLHKENSLVVQSKAWLDKECARPTTDDQKKRCDERHKLSQQKAAHLYRQWDEYNRLEAEYLRRVGAAPAA